MKVKHGPDGKIETYVLELQREFEMAYHRFVSVLENSASFATLSEQLNEVLLARHPLPDPPHPIRFGVAGKTALEVAAPGYLDRCVRQAITSVLVGVEECLLTPYVVLCIWRELRSATDNRANFIEMVKLGQERRKKTRHEHVWDLVRDECKALGYKPVFKYEDHYASLRRMRNCLAHRDGVISDLDVGSDGFLLIRWNDVIPVFKGKEVVQVPFQAQESGSIRIRFDKKNRKYRIGETITFDARDCHSVLWTLLHFVRDVLTEVDRAITSDQTARRQH